MANNDFTATAGISMKQWEKDIAKMTGTMDDVADKAGWLTKKFQQLGSAYGIHKAIGFAKEMLGLSTQLNDTARKVDVNVESFQRLKQATNESISKDELVGALDAISNAMDGANSGATEMAVVLKEVGISADDVANHKTENGFLAIADAVEKGTVNLQQLNRLFGGTSRGLDEVFKKGGGNLRQKMSEATVVSGTQAGIEKKMDRQIEQMVEKAKRSLWDALTDPSGAKKAAIQMLTDIEAQKKKAEEIKNPTKPAEPAKKANTVDLAKAQSVFLEESEKTNISLESRIEMTRSELKLMEAERQIKEKAFGRDSIAEREVRVRMHEKSKEQAEYYHQLDMTQRAAKNATTELDVQLAGNKALADLTKNRLGFELKIAQAVHEKRFDVAEELRKQQALSELEIKAKQLRRTPKQVRDERKEQEKQDLAIRHINAIEKNNPNQIAADGRNHISKAAARARAEFAARHAAPAVKAADKQVNEIKAKTIVVQAIKSSL